MTEGLTRRELQCLKLAGDGLTNKEIARRLGSGVSPKTVANHLSNAYAKIGVSNRVQAAGLIGADYPGLSRFNPIPSAKPASSGSGGGEPGGDAGESLRTNGSSDWMLPPPPRGRGLRLLLIALFAALAAVFILGVVGVMWATLSLTAPQAPKNAMSSISPSRTPNP